MKRKLSRGCLHDVSDVSPKKQKCLSPIAKDVTSNYRVRRQLRDSKSGADLQVRSLPGER